MAYVEAMHQKHLDLAAEYLLLAALLAEIKSRLLLPQRTSVDEEEDPRAELVRRLQEYERFKQAAEGVDELEREERDFSVIKVAPITEKKEIPQPEVSLEKLMHVFNDILQRVDLKVSHQIKRETISIRARMTEVLARLKVGEMVTFESLLLTKQGRLGVVVTFMAILELLKSRVIDLKQDDTFGSIYVMPVSASEEVGPDAAE
jgi:segregation and condensation protein A